MFNLDLTDEQYEARQKEFEAFKDTKTKEPSGSDVKKEYTVGCFQESDWQFIHAELMKDGSLEDNIPTNKCDCINDCLQSPVRGTYLLTDTEASELRANSKVDYVQINQVAYPGTYAINPDELTNSRTYRYASTVKNQQDVDDPYNTINTQPVGQTGGTGLPAADKLNRCTSQLYRHTQKRNPWVVLGNPQTIIDDRLYKTGTGKDIDLIVCDDHCWFGHMEFQNPSRISNIKQEDGAASTGVTAPSDYVGGNVLGSGFSSSSTNGSCDVLDVILEAPYYIDPAWFEASAGTRLTTRWDGTTVPVESVARDWWSNASQRSSQFAAAGTVPSSAVSSYTRTNSNGTLTDPGSPSPTSTWYSHGTPCASQAYGRSYGWAYNANKWYINLYGDGGVMFESCFDIVKIFHQNKPNRSSDNTKNPTITSNSWGRRFSSGQESQSTGYYYYRPATTDGTTSGTQYTSWTVNGNTDGSGGTAPRFMTNRISGGYQIQYTPVSGATFTAYNEMNAAGVFFVCAAGNHNQKMVKSTHPDYNNYVSPSNNTALSATQFTYSSDGLNYIKTINRGGFPQAFNEAIVVGALDNIFNSGKEQKANYSSMGDLVTLWATSGGFDPSAGSVNLSNAASKISMNNNSGYLARYDSTYEISSTQSYQSDDRGFNGTSSATPIACGLLATKLETNRNWSYSDIISWLNGLGTQDTSDFYYGSDTATSNSTDWSDKRSLQGGNGLVIYDGETESPSSTQAFRTLSLDVDGDVNVSGAATVLGAATVGGTLNVGGDITATSGSNQVVFQVGDGSLEITRSTGDAYIDFKTSTGEDYDARIAQDGTNAGLVITGDLSVSGTLSGGNGAGAILRWTLGANGSSDYTFTGPGGLSGTADPKLYLARGHTYEFVNNSGGSHPFQIQDSGGSPYNTGVTNNGASSGTITFSVPFSAPNTLQYKCTSHSSMGNTIIVYPDLSP